jgi:hypothetical protein
MTLISDQGWRLWVAKGYTNNYYYIAHPECLSGKGIGASCGMVAVNDLIRQEEPSCYSCYEAPPAEMLGMISLIEWER